METFLLHLNFGTIITLATMMRWLKCASKATDFHNGNVTFYIIQIISIEQ